MASGGAYLALLAGFWDEMEASPGGRRLQARVDSYSGSSAGAITGSLMAMRVPATALVNEVRQGGLHGSMKYLRALAVYLGLRKSMYDGDTYVRRLQNLSRQYKGHGAAITPMTVAVTNRDLVQKSLTYRTREGLVNAAVASASVPYVLPERYVAPVGMCVDGSVNQASFADDVVIGHLKSRSGQLMLLNTMPWPGFRARLKQHRFGANKITRLWYEALYAHGMEHITRQFDPPIRFQDGSFSVRVDNRGSGRVKQSSTGNLLVHFVAPTSAQFVRCGGLASAGKLNWSRRDKNIGRMLDVGREMARTFVRNQPCR